MKGLQIRIDERVDAPLAVEAARLGTSKAALIRAAVGERYDRAADEDPLSELTGWLERSADDSACVDDVVYGS